MFSSSRGPSEFELNPYESFMRNHLKHYGYYTGQNDHYKTSHLALSDWERGRSYSLRDPVASDTEYENQALKENKLDDAFHKLNSTITNLSAIPSWQEIFYNRFTDGQKRTTQLVFSHSAGKLVPKLREPRNLYALSKEAGPQQAPRWPADMEVLPETIQQISYVPKEREPFYQPTGFEKMPMAPADLDGRTVYYNPASKDAYFLRSRVGGSRKGCLPRSWKPKTPDDTTLIFEARFESGNLMKVTQRSEFEYDLQLRYDLYTEKHTQWFYFRVQNVRKNIKYRFTITNFMKPGSLYNCGMKPLMYSEKNANTRKIGWQRLGEEIKYYKNDMRRTDVKGDHSYYSLTWICQFPHDGDTCYFAHCYPYTYSDLQEYLLRLSNDPARSKYCKQRVLCRSLAGNLIYILTITSPTRNPDDAKRKKGVVLTARVHPGETNASWMMKGFLDYLTSDSIDAKLLRDTFVFKIVPMLNPDGVIVGNYRCSLAGRDLNRNYRSVLRDSFPSVSNTKFMIKKLLEEREVAIYCDLHGHSRKQNIFMYGCENKKSKNDRLKERIFPLILGKNSPEKFNVSNCKFKVQKSKEGTGRVVMWQMGITNSYTMEATFCGSTLGENKFHHFRTVDYEAMGYHFCDSLLDYCDPDQSKCDMIYQGLEEKLRDDILIHLERMGTPIPEGGTVDLTGDYTSGVESSTTGSDSSVDDGLPVHLIALVPKLTRKKKLKTRKERDKKRNSLDKSKENGKAKEGKEKGKSKPKTPKKDNKGKKPSMPKPKETEGMEKDQTLKYKHASRQTVHSAGRARHIQSRSGDGLPVFARERCDSKAMQKTEYLEALTNAYLMTGVLKSTPEDVPSFRYTPTGFGVSSSGLPLAHLESLCTHHEKAFADQFVTNQLSGLTFEEDKADWNQAQPPKSAVVRERRSATPSKSSPFSLVNMATLRSQSESPPHYLPLPLDEYIRPTVRQGPSLMTGSIHHPSAALRPGSRGLADDTPIEAIIIPQRPASYADFVRRESEPPSSSLLRQAAKHTSTSMALEEYQSSSTSCKVPQVSGNSLGQLGLASSHARGTSSPSNIPPPERRKVITPAHIESMTRENPQYKDAHMQKSAAVLRAHNTPVKIISGSSPIESRTPTNQATMGTRRRSLVNYCKDIPRSSPQQAMEEISLSHASILVSQPPFKSDRTSVPQEPKIHWRTVEATPISDPVVFTAKTATKSSHHCKPSSQRIYGSHIEVSHAASLDRLLVSHQQVQTNAERVPVHKRRNYELENVHSVKQSPTFNNCAATDSNTNFNNSAEFDSYGSQENYRTYSTTSGLLDQKNERRILDLKSPLFDPKNFVTENIIDLSDVSIPDLDLSFPVNDIKSTRSSSSEMCHFQTHGGNSYQIKHKKQSSRETSRLKEKYTIASRSPHFRNEELAYEREDFATSVESSSSRRPARTSDVVGGRGSRRKVGSLQFFPRQRMQSGFAYAQDLQDLQDADEPGREMDDGTDQKISDSTLRWRQGAERRVTEGSPILPTDPRHHKNANASTGGHNNRFSIGTEIFSHRNFSPRSADHYIRVSKLALQYRQRNLEEKLSDQDGERREIQEGDGGRQRTMRDKQEDVEYKGNYDNIRIGPMRTRMHPITNKMVAIVTPMTQRGDPVRQSRYETKETEVTRKVRGGSSQVVVHQGGFQGGTRTTPSHIFTQQKRKK